MIQDEKDIEIAKLKLRLKKKHSSNKHLIESLAVYDAMLKYEKQSYYKLEAEYNRLNRKFESNFKFHEYIKDALYQSADLMENHDAVRQ